MEQGTGCWDSTSNAAEAKAYLQVAEGGGVVGGQGAVELVGAQAQGGERRRQGGGQRAGQLVAEGGEAQQRLEAAGVEAGRDAAAEAGVGQLQALQGAQAARTQNAVSHM